MGRKDQKIAKQTLEVQRASAQYAKYAVLIAGVGVLIALLALFKPQTVSLRIDPRSILDSIPVEIDFVDLDGVPLSFDTVQTVVRDSLDMGGVIDTDDLIRIGNVLLIKGRFAEAESYYRVALHQSRATNDSVMIGRATGALGQIFQQRGEVDSALACLQASLTILHNVGYPRGEAAALGTLGKIYILQGEWDLALFNLRRAVAINRDIENGQGLATQLGNIGVVYKRLGNLEEALKHFKEALEIDRNIDYRLGEGIALGSIASVYELNGDVPAALESYRKAVAIHREVGYVQGEAIQTANIGLLYQSEGELDSALVYLNDALSLLDEHGLTYARNTITLAIEEIKGQQQGSDSTP